MNKIFLSAYKKTLYLNKGNADTPLTAVDTLTSQLCCSAKVVEKTFHRHPERSEESSKTHFKGWILHFASAPFRMTIDTLTLAAVLSVGIISESMAATTCTLTGTKLIISGSGAMSTSNCPPGWKNTTTEIEIGKGVTSIKTYAFYNMTGVTSLTIPDSVTNIGERPFQNMGGVTSLTIPDSVTSIGSSVFSYMSGLTELVIPDSWAELPNNALNDSMFNGSCFAASNRPRGCSSDAKIICQGGMDNCYEALAKYFTPETCPQSLRDAGKSNMCMCTSSGSNCIDPSRIKQASKDQCTGSKYYWSGSSCNNKKNGINCDENFKQIETWCNRIRYTPAEAAKVLQDTGNEIIMIFKANR